MLYTSIVIWIDDLLVFADDIDDYVVKLEEFFDLVAAYGLNLSAKTSSIYQQSVKWCGRIINNDGDSHDPARVDVLRSMSYPETAGLLQQFLCAANG
ncbi:Retroelement [Phytophthora megakarya]|uniref:Retroelement n=1 Tax=Phytophthora megakarya TaxID=4795 RepID=A0A225V541_9STRA|nr:Retroelement [Phytophthora megakarya]